MPASRESSQPRDQTHISCVSCTADGLFTTESPEVCGSVNCSVVSNSLQLPGLWLTSSCVLGVLQARLLEWLVIPFSRGFSQPKNPSGFSNLHSINSAEGFPFLHILSSIYYLMMAILTHMRVIPY